MYMYVFFIKKLEKVQNWMLNYKYFISMEILDVEQRPLSQTAD